MSKKITLAIFLLTVLTFSTVASSYAAFEVSPRESDMRTTSIFNDDLYVQQISAPAPTSSPYAQRILNQEVPQVKEKTLLGALLFSKYGKPVLGSQISYQRKLSNDPNAIRLSQTRSILRDDTTLRDYYLSNTVKNNKYFGRVRTQSNWGGRVTSRRALYSGTGLSYQRLLSKEVSMDSMIKRGTAQRFLLADKQLSVSSILYQRSLRVELGLPMQNTVN